jgi:hypothetical protein
MSAPTEPTPPSDRLAADNFELEFYKAHRAHEVALNNATGAYEQSALRLVLVVNAAAIPVFLGLVQAAGKAFDYDFCEARIAIYCWAAGVACAFVATVFGYFSQRGFTQAYRSRRQAIEASRVVDKELLRTMYGVHKGKEILACEAYMYRRIAGRQQYGVYVFGVLAVLCSVLGFIIAVNSIRPSAQSTTAAPASAVH